MRRILAMLLLLAPAAASASVPELFGMGARSPALAGTGIAGSSTWEAAYANPAGLEGAIDRRLTLGYLYGHFATSIDGVPRVPEDTHATIIGATLPLPLGGVLRDRLTIGLGFITPTGLVTRARVPALDVPRLALLESRTQVVGLDIAASVRLTDRIAVGFGALALAALTGRVILTADAAGRIGALSNQQLVADYAMVAGVRVVATDTLVLGAAFRGESLAGFDVAIDNRLGDKLPISLPEIRVAGVAQYDPLQVGVEAAAQPFGRRTMLVGGVTWKRWSAFPRPTEKPSAKSAEPPAPNFSDTWVPRLAVEHALDRVLLRGGVFFEPTPSPEGTPYLDNHRFATTLGAGLPLLPFHFDLFYQWHLLLSRQHSSGMLHVAGITVGVDL